MTIFCENKKYKKISYNPNNFPQIDEYATAAIQYKTKYDTNFI